MYKERNGTELLSDDEFERVGRKKKILIFTIIFILVSAVAILIFMFIIKKSDDNINVRQATEKNTVNEEATDEMADSKNIIVDDEVAGSEVQEKTLQIGRVTVAGDHEFICEYSEIYLPEMLKTGDYADVRLSLADGRNYTVTSEKRIMDFNKSGDKSYVYLTLCEEEIIILESAISDLKIFEGSKLYLVIGKQKTKTVVNYPVNKRADRLLHTENEANNLSGYSYKVEFDNDLEKERLKREKEIGLKGQEWKETASYWNDKE